MGEGFASFQNAQGILRDKRGNLLEHAGVLKHLFAHDGSFPGAGRRSDCRSDLKVGAA